MTPYAAPHKTERKEAEKNHDKISYTKDRQFPGNAPEKAGIFPTAVHTVHARMLQGCRAVQAVRREPCHDPEKCGLSL